MAFLKIDETKCKQDGICAAECPRGIIIQENDKSFPQVAKADEAYCMACGHCVAVCPHGALSVSGVDIENCPEIERDLLLPWDQAEQFLRSRRSIRLFKDKPIDRETLEQLIKTARYAPNRLELLKGDRENQYSIRINQQYRICFTWEEGDAYEIEITDYHK